MSTRHAEIHRTTAETDVVVSMELDGSGTSHIDTGIGFFDHMLTLFAAHARVDLTVTCHGDIEVDGHHTVEDQHRRCISDSHWRKAWYFKIRYLLPANGRNVGNGLLGHQWTSIFVL